MPFVECSREKDWMFPPTLRELVPERHEVHFVAHFADCLFTGCDPVPSAENGCLARKPRVVGRGFSPAAPEHSRLSKAVEDESDRIRPACSALIGGFSGLPPART